MRALVVELAQRALTVIVIVVVAASGSTLHAQPTPWTDAPAGDWIQLFDGESLEGWTPKIRGRQLGDDPLRTFRVDDGKLVVRYDGNDAFDEQFGHLFWREPRSHYVIAVEVRFVGAQVPDAPAWARMNSGIMVHSQSPESMLRDQDFPISIEAQLLAGDAGERRPTANLCTPGTHVERDGELVAQHCVESSSRTVAPGEWARVEIVVLGNERIEHRVDGQVVLTYQRPQVGGGVVTGFDPAVKKDGMLLSEGYIALQAEGQPIDFRRVELMNLSGCMNPKASNYKSYYVHRDDSKCVGGN